MTPDARRNRALSTTLVLGATGRVGRRVTGHLLAADVRVRALVRDPARVLALPSGAELVRGDFADAASLAAACAGVDQVCLISAVEEDLAAQQGAAIEAARRAGVRRMVKLSGSSWTMREGDMTATGAAHLASEGLLRKSGMAFAIVRPNPFMQGSLDAAVLALAQSADADHLPMARGTARAGVIHIDDIAAVCAHALLAADASNAVHEITGPASLSGDDIAREASAVLGRTIRYRAIPVEAALERMRQQGITGYALRHLRENMERVAAGYADVVTGEVARLLGRPARSVREFLVETLGSPRA